MDHERQELLNVRSERVKGIDFHPTEPWILTTLYSGRANIWSFETQEIVKSFELTDVPVRAGRFIARKNWIVCGSDDFQIRTYNYNTSQKVTSFEAHPDYIRAIVVHPTQPFILSASDDMTIKLWDWERGWKCMKTYEGHSHYVMGLAINPKDTNTFASACLDRTVKIWSIDSERPNYTIEAHSTKGVNYVDYYPHADNPYLLTTSDDQTVKIWDYTQRTVVNVLGGDPGENRRKDGHTSNVSFACYHPVLPLIISGSEDGTIMLWSAITYECLKVISYGLERAWCVSHQHETRALAFGFDDGAVVVKIGRDEPVISMNQSGWFTWYAGSEIHTGSVKQDLKDNEDEKETDGRPTPIHVEQTVDFSSFQAQAITYPSPGVLVAVCGSTDYMIYRRKKLKAVHQGSGTDFVWRANTSRNIYAKCIRQPDKADVVTITQFTPEKDAFTTEQVIQTEGKVLGLIGGPLLGVKASGGIYMYDWDTRESVEWLENTPNTAYWSNNGEFVALIRQDNFSIYRYLSEAHRKKNKAENADDDNKSVFELVADINEKVRSGAWVEDCFVYSDMSDRLHYLVGEQTNLVSPLNKPMYILGYNKSTQRVYLSDRDGLVVSYELSLALLDIESQVLRGDIEAAVSTLENSKINESQRNKIAHFLEAQGHKELALDITSDKIHRFDLALSLQNLDIAIELAKENDIEEQWKSIGDVALATWNMKLAEECFTNAKDLSSLLLLYTAANNASGLQKLAIEAEGRAAHNVAFACLWHIGDLDGCIDLLVRSDRFAEAALFSRTYKPSRSQNITLQWKTKLEKSGKGKVSRMIAIPPSKDDAEDGENLFPGWGELLSAEESQAENGVESPLVDVNAGSEEDNSAAGHATEDTAVSAS